ncbi:calcium-binding protein [Nostoc sp. TCL26-01]|uniref:beta strand repeat-containing protein n=1 Tax=Nostoc sp. TCL26-01 TaxID=2576904 RepID=UPI0015BD293B|nr:calcium-binding protein [Nostoc sp. TCL26-01]QLE57286.1 calcium-binding protein [Nostoc sp. TCL26-01]
MAVIFGDNNDNFLSGTDGDDQIFGRGGNDIISGGLGNDAIEGGDGNDKLAGDGGNDTFKGGQGNDSINGGDDTDTADYSYLGRSITLSGVGTVEKAGGLGKDQLFKVERVIADATVANNTIDASQSLPGVPAVADLQAQTISALNVPGLGTLTFNVINFDNVIGTNEDDSIKGDGQRNQLFGKDGNDLIEGRGGDDLIDGGAGSDKLAGDTGNDTFIGGQGDDSIDGGDGVDTADYSKLGRTITLLGVGTIDKGKLGQDQLFKVETVIADASVVNNTIDASQSLPGVPAVADLQAQTISALNVPGLGTLTFNVINFDNVIGTNEDDSIKGDGQRNQLFGKDGNDLIEGRGGDDLIDGGAGSDKLAGDTGNDTFIGGQGDDSIDGGDGVDTADYSKLGRTITLLGVGTIDKGKLGQDQVFKVERVIADATVANNTIDASQSLPGVPAVADLEAQTISALNVPGLGILTFNVINFDNVIGTDENDQIGGDRQDNQLSGLGGDDIFKGSRGNDSIDGGKGFDTANYGSLGRSITLSGIGTITKSGGFGTDQLFLIEKIIADGSAANNTIDASLSFPGVFVTVDLQAQSLIANNVELLGNSEPVTLPFTVVNFDDVIGTKLNDTIAGDDQANKLSGNDGNDVIDGRAGNDLIDGGAGSDKLIGGADYDTFKGSQGDDSIDGGDGVDTADYSKLGKTIILSGVGTVEKAGGLGKDQLFQVETVIADASVANNTIDASQSLPGVPAIADLQAQTISALNVPGLGTLTFNVINFDNVIGTNDNDKITGDNQNNRLLGNAGDDIISGGFGNDTITGGLGKDTLTGGFGADTFIFNALVEGIDVIKDYKFAEADKIQVSKLGFGANSINDFTYDNSTGNLSFLGTQFAFIENLASNLSIQLV